MTLIASHIVTCSVLYGVLFSVLIGCADVADEVVRVALGTYDHDPVVRFRSRAAGLLSNLENPVGVVTAVFYPKVRRTPEGTYSGTRWLGPRLILEKAVSVSLIATFGAIAGGIFPGAFSRDTESHSKTNAADG